MANVMIRTNQKLGRLNSLLTERFGVIVEEVLKIVDNAVTEFSQENEMIKVENQYLRHQFRRLQKNDSNFMVNSEGVGPSGQNDCTGEGSQEQKTVELEVEVSMVSQPSSECGDSELASVPVAEHHMVKLKSASGEKSSTAKPSVVSVGTQADIVLDECDQQNELRKSVCPSFSAPGKVASENGGSLPASDVRIMFPLSEQASERIRKGETAYLCRFCGTVCFHLTEMKRHEDTHFVKTVKYQCSDCYQSFFEIDTLKKHELMHSRQKPHSCSQCSKRFSDPSNLKAHSLVHKYAGARGKELKMTTSSSQFTEHVSAPESGTCSSLTESEKEEPPPAVVSTHGQDGNEKGESVLKRPGTIFTFLSNPGEVRERIIIKKRTCLCEECGKTFFDASSLARHKLSHKVENHQCSYCDKRFSVRSNLTRHERLHTGEKPYSCTYCGKRFSDASVKRSHMWHKHENKVEIKKSHRCDLCDKAFTHKHLLDKHTRLHTRSNSGALNSHTQVCRRTGNKKKQGCSEMSVGSSIPFELESTQELMVPQVEVEIESSPPSYEWENKKAKVEPSDHEKPSGSSVSINAPTAESCESKEYSCRWCEMKLRTFTAITRHERVHTGEKPFACSYCKKSFSLLSNKQRHERLHTGEKPYCCNYCEKRYVDSSGLRFHVKTHLKERKKKLPR